MIFYIPSVEHLAQSITMPRGRATFKQFTDGEWHVHVHDDVRNKKVWVLAQTGAPADTIVQLVVLCDALQRAGAIISLFLSYMGYARQDRLLPGQALSVQAMCTILEMCKPSALHALQLHNPSICSSLFVNHIPYHFFEHCIKDADIVVAPDKGAATWAGPIAAQAFCQLVCIEKQRPAPEHVTMQLIGDVRGKKVLIVDDMITTGSTIIEAARLLQAQGATHIRVACTHGLFTGNAFDRLRATAIEHIFVTNSLAQRQLSDTLTIVDIGPYLQNILQETT